MSAADGGAGVRYVVAGAGGMGREALAWARDAWPAAEAVAFWIARGGPHPTGAALPIVDEVGAGRRLGATHVVLGIGDNARRRAVAEEAAVGGLEALTVVHPTAFLGPGVAVAGGSVIAPGTVLTRDIVIDSGSIINYRAAVGHGALIGAWAFVGPGAVLAGDVAVGDSAAIGLSAAILPGCRIGSGAVVGAGAVVVTDVPGGATVVGNPARPMGTNHSTTHGARRNDG